VQSAARSARLCLQALQEQQDAQLLVPSIQYITNLRSEQAGMRISVACADGMHRTLEPVCTHLHGHSGAPHPLVPLIREASRTKGALGLPQVTVQVADCYKALCCGHPCRQRSSHSRLQSVKNMVAGKRSSNAALDLQPPSSCTLYLAPAQACLHCRH
jgi:hypothetical protein